VKELIIIGAGPAGLTAAIYGIRAGLDLALIERLSPGGQVMNTYEVENYPGFVVPIPGWELVSNIENQTRRLGVEIINGDVVRVSKNSKGVFTAQFTESPEMEAKSVIAASGASYRRLKIPGEEEFVGKGVSFCGTCDGPFYKDRVCAVIGAGNAALEEVDFLTRFVKKVYLIHRRDRLRGEKILQERVFANSKIEPVFDSVVESITGGAAVEKLNLKNLKTGKAFSLAVDGVFIFIGFDCNIGFLPDQVINEKREVIVDINMKTPLPGLFAAGDLRCGSKRQIVMAAADGATAAMEAYEYVLGLT
jgi:thioredoxin reductase (NADPH)